MTEDERVNVPNGGTGSGIHAVALSGRTRILISVSESVENGVNMYVNHINVPYSFFTTAVKIFSYESVVIDML